MHYFQPEKLYYMGIDLLVSSLSVIVLRLKMAIQVIAQVKI